MILIGVRLQLAPHGRRSALDETDFLGGVLHGSVEHLARQHAPHAAAQLGMTDANRIKPYAILPPPFGWHAHQTQDHQRALPFGIALHGPAACHANALAQALTHWQHVRCGTHQDEVRAIQLSVSVPSGPTMIWSPAEPWPTLVDASPAIAFPPCRSLTIRFLTPLVLTSGGRDHIGPDHRPPSLLRLVRALRRRIESTNPPLFEQMAGRDWIHHEETIRPLEAQTPHWQPVQWRYGSRTKQTPITFHGQLGTLHFCAQSDTPIPGPIHTLLQWGTWFGVGQRTALGHGMYLIQESTP